MQVLLLKLGSHLRDFIECTRFDSFQPFITHIVSVCLCSFLYSLSLLFFFSFFKKVLSQCRRHVHLTFDISLSSRVYTIILIERLQISCRPHDTWSSKLLFFWAQITDSFVQIRDVLQPAPPLLLTTVLTFREKGRSFCYANSFFAFLLKVWAWDM